jgi:hypothetical protein
VAPDAAQRTNEQAPSAIAARIFRAIDVTHLRSLRIIVANSGSIL